MTESSKPVRRTPEERRRRRARLAWIPTGIIVLIIIAAIILAMNVWHSSGKAIVEQAGNSTFDKAGSAEIVRTADAQIDVRGPRRASVIGLPANGDRSFGPFNNIMAEVDLVGTHGTISLFADSFLVTSKDDYLTTVTTTTTEYDYTDLHTKLVEFEVLGITPAQMASFVNAMPNGAGGPSSHFDLDVGTGNALGVPTRVNVKCSGPAGCAITTTTTLDRN